MCPANETLDSIKITSLPPYIIIVHYFPFDYEPDVSEGKSVNPRNYLFYILNETKNVLVFRRVRVRLHILMYIKVLWKFRITPSKVFFFLYIYILSDILRKQIRKSIKHLHKSNENHIWYYIWLSKFYKDIFEHIQSQNAKQNTLCHLSHTIFLFFLMGESMEKLPEIHGRQLKKICFRARRSAKNERVSHSIGAYGFLAIRLPGPAILVPEVLLRISLYPDLTFITLAPYICLNNFSLCCRSCV